MTSLEGDGALAEQIVRGIEAVVGQGPRGLHEPHFAGNEWAYFKECLDSTFVSSVGPFVDRFERALREYTGASYAIAVVNGTAALHLALRLVGVERDDEVLTPTLSFIAAANAISYCGAIPHFVESEDSSFGIDAGTLREYLRTSSDCQWSVYQSNDAASNSCTRSHACLRSPGGYRIVGRSAREFHLELVEDAAESLGSTIGSRHTGTFGRLGTFSFNGNKTITTGGGGAIVTNDAELARQAKHLSTTAKVPIHGPSFTTRLATTIECRTSMPRLDARNWNSFRICLLRSESF